MANTLAIDMTLRYIRPHTSSLQNQVSALKHPLDLYHTLHINRISWVGSAMTTKHLRLTQQYASPYSKPRLMVTPGEV